MWNLPNILTLMRIAMIPVFIVVYYLPLEWHHFASAAIFGIAAALTDWVDGYFRSKIEYGNAIRCIPWTRLQINLLSLLRLILLLIEVHSYALVFALPAIIIIGRELVISASERVDV